MYFLTNEERQLLVKALLPAARGQVVANDLRGWSWSEPPMAAPYNSVRLGVSEVANRYCDTGRDIWWRRVRSVKAAPSERMLEGRLLHEVVAKIIARAKRLIWTLGIDHPSEVIEGIRQFDEIWFAREISKHSGRNDWDELMAKAKTIWTYESAIIEARLREALSRQPHALEDSIITAAIPVIMEQRVDGSLVGLSKQLSIDAYQSAEPILLELKFGEKKHFHKVQVAGYALVAESLFEYPLNLGCVVYPSFSGGNLVVEKEFFLVDEELRQQFLEQRDDKMRMVFEEIEPPLMDNCPKDCPYYKNCWATEASA